VPQALLRNAWRADWLRAGIATIFVAVVASSFTGTARAEAKPPNPGASSVAQYVELIPTADGPTAPGVGLERRTPLPPGAKRALDNASKSTAASLATIATSSSYGAPPRPQPGALDSATRDRPQRTAEPSLDRTLQAIAEAAAPVGDDRVFGLLSILVAVTVGGAVVAVRRRVE
jgi:hypothetical protein